MSVKKGPKDESFRDHLATVDEKGRRIWVYPKKQKGKYYWRRTIVAAILLIIFLVGPFIKVHGDPLMLFDVLHKQFFIFGVPFTPDDNFLFAVAMITMVVVIVLFTAVFGRLFCGWVCPQTIFMEHVFRRIEYAIEGDANQMRRLDKSPWTKEKIWKKGLKWTIFYLISLIVAHYFLAYVIGADKVLQLIREPVSAHLGGFIAMLIFSFVFFMVFANLREQVCTTICPYGRLQGVMLDKNSIVVSYDFERGEPRGPIKKKKGQEDQEFGDCIDCELCVKVCPTGIDIRNGTQLECINCTLCMDACDSIMEKVHRPKGLIRYASYNSIVNHQPNRVFTPRSIAYTVVMVALLGFLGFLVANRGQVNAKIQRARGTIYMEVDEDYGKDLFNYQIKNNTRKPLTVDLKLLNKDGRLEMVGLQHLDLQPKQRIDGSFFVVLNKKELTGRNTPIEIGVFVNGKQAEVIKSQFLGP